MFVSLGLGSSTLGKAENLEQLRLTAGLLPEEQPLYQHLVT